MSLLLALCKFTEAADTVGDADDDFDDHGLCVVDWKRFFVELSGADDVDDGVRVMELMTCLMLGGVECGAIKAVFGVGVAKWIGFFVVCSFHLLVVGEVVDVWVQFIVLECSGLLGGMVDKWVVVRLFLMFGNGLGLHASQAPLFLLVVGLVVVVVLVDEVSLIELHCQLGFELGSVVPLVVVERFGLGVTDEPVWPESHFQASLEIGTTVALFVQSFQLRSVVGEAVLDDLRLLESHFHSLFKVGLVAFGLVFPESSHLQPELVLLSVVWEFPLLVVVSGFVFPESHFHLSAL